MKGRWGEEGTRGQCGERFRRPRTLPVSLCSRRMVGTVPSTLALSGLKSRIQPEGPVSKAQQRWRQEWALLCGQLGGVADGTQCTGCARRGR